jgi:Ca2+-binding RTX toxin-like protein
MATISFRPRPGRLAVLTAAAVWLAGLAALSSGSATAIGGLCNGRPASATWLDASYQPGPAYLVGTDHSDVIIGSDGDDRLDGLGGDDVICGGPGRDRIEAGWGDDAVRGDTDDDRIDGGPGYDTVVGDDGNDTVLGGPDHDFLVGGTGDDVMVGSDDDRTDKIDGSYGFDYCFFGAGDEVAGCEY